MKRPKINGKEDEDGPFLKHFQPHSVQASVWLCFPIHCTTIYPKNSYHREKNQCTYDWSPV